VWSKEQARELLSMEVMHDQLQAVYSSPYEGEDRLATQGSILQKSISAAKVFGQIFALV
jgi:hypothetical protein